MNNIVFQLNGTSYDLSKKNVMSCSFLHPANKHYLQHDIKNIGLDFLTIGEIVSFCDRQVPRDKSDDAWSRRITIVIPVLEIEKWEMVKKDLKNMPHIPQKWDINIDLDSINDDEI